ncbi:MAG TPA: thiamine diphosphokinase [Candidatus Eisenbacteria bacterium]|nr:thiamine diphosphokinase [Candidatus Eisenbacteria bacterium]
MADRDPGPVRAIVLADGTAPARADLDAAWPGWDAGISLVVAADGGARLAEPLGLRIDRWVGDGDSLGPAAIDALRAAGVPVTLAPPDKDESDTELAVLEAVEAGATDLTILGALGGRRLDHALANVALLAHHALVGRSARLLDAGTRITMLSGGASDVTGDGAAATAERRFDGRAGDLVSLFPYAGTAEGVTTEGLRYPLHDEPLHLGPARGLSNVRLGSSATVSVRRGRLLIVESPATFSE